MTNTYRFFLLVFALGVLYQVVGASSHKCHRGCTISQEPMTCEYNFTVEWYWTLSKACWECPFNETDCFRPHCVTGDGKERLVITINRQIPGPAIEVCENDRVVVWVTNSLDDGSTTSVHWHGMHQRTTPFMDGTVHLTQCPILPLETFRHFLPAPTGEHTGEQLGDGLFGALIVRQAETADPQSSLYDHDLSEHTVLVSDWMPVTSHWRFVNLMHHAYLSLPMSALINGRARLFEVPNMYNTSGSPRTSAQTPLSTFTLEKGLRYRFRVISAAQKCPFRIFFDSHTLQIIASDGMSVSPVSVDSMILGPGERYDVVVAADQSVSSYWIRAIGLEDCASPIANGTVTAILKYRNATDGDPRADPLLYTPGTITFKIPPVPILSQPEDLQDTWFCNRSTIKNMELCLLDLCRCTHRLIVNTGQVVEFILVVLDRQGVGHSMHLHGYSFYVLALAPLEANDTLKTIEDKDKWGLLSRKLVNPPLKDTIHIPNRHFAIIRFLANNPGVWFFHCHAEGHLAQGKAVIVQVGTYDEFPPVPNNFPRCGGYLFRNAKRLEQDNAITCAGDITHTTAVYILICIISIRILYGS